MASAATSPNGSLREKPQGLPDLAWKNDQTSLAVAVTRLRRQGVDFQALPYPLHGHMILFWAGQLRHHDPALFHACSMFFLRKTRRFDPVDEMRLWNRLQSSRRSSFPAAGHAEDVEVSLLYRRLESLASRYVYPAMASNNPSMRAGFAPLLVA